MVKISLLNRLTEAFNATGIAFDGQAAIAEAATVDIRTEARKQEQAQQDELNEIDNNFARRTPAENEEVGAPGRIGTNQAQANAHESLQKQKKEKDLARFLSRLQEQRIEFERQINWTIKYFEQKAAEAAAQAGELRQTIVDNTERMIENSNFIREVEQLLKADKDGISIDKDKLRKLLKGQGANVDENTPLPLLLQTAEKMVIEANEENAILEIDNDIHDKAASKFEALEKEYGTQAKDLKSKFEELKAQNLSEEDYKAAATKILEGVPFEVRQEYEKKKGVFSEADNEVQEENSKKENEAEAFDAFAFMDELPTENSKQESQKPLVSSPSPNGM